MGLLQGRVVLSSIDGVFTTTASVLDGIVHGMVITTKAHELKNNNDKVSTLSFSEFKKPDKTIQKCFNFKLVIGS